MAFYPPVGAPLALRWLNRMAPSRGFNSRAGSAYSSCGPAARVTRTRGEKPGLGLERRPPAGRALDIYLRLRHDSDDSLSLSPRALLGILLPGLVWLVYYLAAYSARSRPAMPAGTCPEPISPYIPPYLTVGSIRILAYCSTYGTANFRILNNTTIRDFVWKPHDARPKRSRR